MADIKQAAKWLKCGFEIRRPYLAADIGFAEQSVGPFKALVVMENGVRARDKRLACLDSDDLLAEDWEIAE